MKKIYADEEEIPQEFTDCLADLEKRLIEARQKHGKDIVPPSELS